MKIYKVKNYDELSRKAANIIAAQITLKPDSVLGLATGSSPVGLYKNLVSMYENGDLDFSKITTVNLEMCIRDSHCFSINLSGSEIRLSPK